MKHRIQTMALTVGLAAVLAGCSSSAAVSTAAVSASSSASVTAVTEAAYHKITAEEAKSMIDQGGVTIVDVRTQEEYDEKHIPGAVLVPVESIGDTMPEALPDKDAVLLVHCRTGVRSKKASDKLVKLGYTHVYDFGGIVDWPYETESSAG
ncbi:MAG: rhodanese-like domain-containing protein [Solobacterium sp.]|nr:rhodanese-like domain-containing protein [Solobacterium sp.]MCH4222444.1 rhodanese-like domain-containing protein [Solobacterium sp.]MCH4265854.1 rhodanese-like domain-containing protein [Solobacterium sp.]